MNKRLSHMIVLAMMFFMAGPVWSQVFQPGDYRDGIYTKENSVNRRFIPYTFLREADVQWNKRVWRDIDMREKVNQPLYYPIEPVNGRISLFQLIADHVLKGEIIAFQDEEFLKPLQLADVKQKIVKCDSAQDSNVDAEGNEIITSVWRCDSTSIYRNIRSFRLKEEWFFDKQKSVMEVRILGIGIYTYDEEKEAVKELFWIYFPACRPYFAMHEVFNTKNDAERRTFEDVFWKRQFNSYVIKENNVYDRYVSEYSKGIDALLEAERVKKEIFQYEHDFWHL